MSEVAGFHPFLLPKKCLWYGMRSPLLDREPLIQASLRAGHAPSPLATQGSGACTSTDAVQVNRMPRFPRSWAGLFFLVALVLAPALGARPLHGADASTLDGKIMCGYQGWFFAPGDGSGNSWVHWGPQGKFGPGYSTVDLWPDMTELGPDEQFASGFKYADGTVATVFSSYVPKTVDRHFRWMAQYGIDGVFLGRFGAALRDSRTVANLNVVLDNVRRAASANGRTWCIEYDLTGMQADEVPSLIMTDWKNLVDRLQITAGPAYQKQNGKPVVGLWGVGFENRPYTTQGCGELVDFLKNDPRYGGNAVMLGVPKSWRTLSQPAMAGFGRSGSGQDPLLASVIKKADIVSPWTVGRYGTVNEFQAMLRNTGRGDLAWCQENHLAYMPVIFPGSSWYNMRTFRGMDAGGPIAREHGNFLWKQGVGWVDSGVRMLFVAMFDEVDEGTAIFKVTNHPPVSDRTRFASLEGDPSDLYLWLTGKLGAMLKGREPVSQEMPRR
jgi:glycoprotein endo-alpha-1,2-mannosidase